MKNKIEIQIQTPATREQLIELRDEIRKIEGLEAFDLQMPPAPLVQGKMSGIAMVVVEAVIAGVTHFAAEKAMEEYHGQIATLMARILGRKKNAVAEELAVEEMGADAEKMSGTLAVDADKWKVSISETKNGTKSVTAFDANGSKNIYTNREFSIDPEHTYAILIGVSDYDDSANFSRIPPVAGNLDEMYRIFTDKRLVGLPFENVTRLFNENCITIKDELRRVSRIGDIKTLMIYYSGHGQNTGANQLSLVAKDTRNLDEELHNDIPYSFVEKMMNSSPADQKIVFIDACHSGLAAQGNSNVFDFEPVLGTFTLASTSAEEASYFKRDAANTYFTTYLAQAFNEGIANSNTMLSLTDLYKYTSEKLQKNRLPAPVNKAQLKNIVADKFYISGNPGFSLEARLNMPKQLYQQGRYEEARKEYILLEKEYPENLQLRNEHIEFERNVEYNKLVKDGDILYFREKNYNDAIGKYREALAIKYDESIRDKITACTRALQDAPQNQTKPEEKQQVIEKKEEQHKQAFGEPVKKTIPPKPDPIKKKSKLPLMIAAGVAVILLLIFVLRFHGERTLLASDGTTYLYKGETKDGRPDGDGLAKYKNGNSYDGEWTNGLPDGKGTYTYANGTVYTGYFKNNYFNGVGQIKYQNGDSYDGNWSYGGFQGKGLYKYQNGNTYDGYWMNNKQNGEGTFTWANGDVYQGNFRDNYRHGTGTYTSPSSDLFNCPGCRKYIGSWKNGLKDGYGTCFDINGKLIYEGSFGNNQPTSPYPNR